MDFERNETQEIIRTGATRFAAEIDFFDAHRAAGGCASRLWDSFVEMGWNGIQAPEAVGGFGGNPEDLLVLLSEIGCGSSAAVMILNVILPSFLLDAGDTGLSSRLLEQLVAGDARIAFGGYEPGSGYALHSPATRARRTAGGFSLAGHKTGVASGLVPDVIIISATVEETGDIALFLVPLDSAGVSVRTSRLIDGTLAFDIGFADVALDAEQSVLLSGGAGDAIGDGIDLATFCACAAALSCMKRAVSLTADYLKVREQFGRSLSQFQALQHRMADMFIAMEDAHSIMFSAMAAMTAAPLVRRRAIAACAVKVMDAARWVTGEAVHLHGGIGFTSEHEVGHLFQKGVVYGRMFGDSEHQFARYADLCAG
jgi:acyl-CoA dehydrogenase